MKCNWKNFPNVLLGYLHIHYLTNQRKPSKLWSNITIHWLFQISFLTTYEEKMQWVFQLLDLDETGMVNEWNWLYFLATIFENWDSNCSLLNLEIWFHNKPGITLEVYIKDVWYWVKNWKKSIFLSKNSVPKLIRKNI